MIKLVKDTIDREDINALTEWLAQDPIPQLTKGPLTVEYEKAFAKSIGVKHAVMVNSGSSANLLAIYLLKKMYGVKKIAIPAVSWITDISPCIQFDIEPVLIDCNLQDLSVDLDHLEAEFKKGDIDAFVLVSVLGLVPDMFNIYLLCAKYDVYLIEDFCESQGSGLVGKKLGSFGLMGTCSTYYGHITGTIEGGMITTNNDDVYYQLLMYRSHGWSRDLPFKKSNDHTFEFEEQYTFYTDGFNVRSTDLNAFLGLRQLKKLDDFINARNKNFNQYFNGIKNTRLTLRNDQQDFIANLGYPVISKNRACIVKELAENNIECRPLISGNLNRHPAFYGLWPKGNYLPSADLVHDYGFYVPNHPYLTEPEIDSIIEIINKYDK